MRTLLLFIPLLFVSCATVSPQTDSIQTVLTTDVALRMALDQCRNTDLVTRQKVEFEHSGWWQRNGQWVLQADRGLVALNWQHSSPFQEASRSVLALQLLESTHQNSKDLTQQWLATADAQTCQALFNRVSNGELDIQLDDEQRQALADIAVSQNLIEADSNAAQAVNARYRKYGRSLYLAEKSLQQVGCSKPNLALIRNNWPLEVYDATCSNNDYFLVKCEWGRCLVKQ